MLFLDTIEEMSSNLDLYIICSALAICGLLMLIINGFFYESSHKKRGIAFSITSLIFSLLFGVAFLIDYIIMENKLYYPFQYYLYFIGSGILYFLIFGLPRIVNSDKNFRMKKENKKMVYEYNPKEEHLYVVFKSDNYVFLKKEEYHGIDIKMRKQDFCDDLLSELIKKYEAIYFGEINRKGIVTLKLKNKDVVYNCYLVNIERDIINEDLEKVYLYDLLKYNINDLDKYIILNLLSGEEFKKTLDK